METKLKAKEILDYVLTWLGIEVGKDKGIGIITKNEYNDALKEIEFMIDND